MTDEVRVQILTHLLEDKHPLLVAELVGFHPTQVHMVQNAHGWPNRKQVQSARDRLADLLAHPEKQTAANVPAKPAEKADIKAPRSAAAKQPAPQAPRTVAQPEPAVANPRSSSPGSLSDLIERGRASRRAKTRSLAEKLVVDVRALREALEEDEREAAAATARERAEQKVRDEIAALQEQLARLRGQSGSKSKGTGRGAAHSQQRERLESLGVTLADVRTWANANGYEIAPTTAILRLEVLDAYEAAVHR